MTQIGVQSPVLTPAKHPEKRVPDKVLLGPKVQFGASELPASTALGRDSSSASVGGERVKVDSLDADKHTEDPPKAPDSQNAIENFVNKITQFFKKLQETVEALLERLTKYLDELGEKLTTPPKKEGSSEPTDGSAL